MRLHGTEKSRKQVNQEKKKKLKRENGEKWIESKKEEDGFGAYLTLNL